MVKVKISDQAKPLQDVNLNWLTSTISKNRVMGKENPVEVNIDSDNIDLNLFANCEQAGQEEASNDIESRITFLWDNLVLSKHDLDPTALSDFLERMEEWVDYVPKN